MSVNFLSSIADNTSLNYTAKQIRTAVGNELGLAIGEDVSMSLRMRSIRAYDVAGRAMSVKVYDLTQASAGSNRNFAAATAVCYPARNGWASVGLKWSHKDQQTVVSVSNNSSGSDNPFLFGISVDSLSDTTLVPLEVLVKVELSWKFSNSAIPTFSSMRALGHKIGAKSVSTLSTNPASGDFTATVDHAPN